MGMDSEQVASLLEGIESSGSVFVVFKSRHMASKALSHCKHNPLVYQGAYNIRLKREECQPATIRWSGFGHSTGEFYWQVTKAVAAIIGAIVMLDTFFYTPYVAYFISWSEVAGLTTGGGFLQIKVVALLTPLCNVIIYQVIALVLEWCPFHFQDRLDQFYLTAYTCAIWCNTVIEIFTELLLAKGFTVDQAFRTKMSHGSALGKSLAEQPSLQQAVFNQMYSFLWPSSLLLPFMVEPLGLVVVPYLLNKWLIRSRRDMGISEAESRLACMTYDLTRYGDVLTNVMLCTVMLLLNHKDLWKIFFFLFVSIGYIYAWDHVRLLRFSSRRFFASPKLDRTAHHLTGLVCGIMASAVVFKIFAIKADLFSDNQVVEEGVKTMLNRTTVLPAMLAACGLHVACHSCFLHYVVPLYATLPTSEKAELKSKAADRVLYKTVAVDSPDNWFTTNPVHCLRSMHLYKHEPPCFPYQAGREHLLMPNSKLGLYYRKQRPVLEGAPTIRDFVLGV